MKTRNRDVIDLSMNEGEPPSRACLDVLKRHGPALLRKYADPAPLEAAYAAYLGAEPANVLATTGGDDAIDRVLRASLAPGREMVFPTPTFEMVPACARMARADLVPVEYEWGTLPHDDILDAVNERTGVVAVLTPDNPTGHAFSTASLLRLADALPPEVTLMVDLAYAEFADEDPTPALLEVPRAIMIRTMSKAWGLAGLRIGFAVGAKRRIEPLRGYGGPYALTGPSIAIALDRLQNGVADMRGFVEYVRSRRDRLAQVLRDAGGAPEPSRTNFVLASFPDARWIQRGMAAQGVLVRYFAHLPEYVRVTVPRDDAEFRRVERALRCLDRPDALLFDMDGVLADVSRSYREAIARTCASFGVDAGRGTIEAAKAAGDANDDWALTHRVLADAGVKATPAEVTARFEELYQGTDDQPGLRRHEDPDPVARAAREAGRALQAGHRDRPAPRRRRALPARTRRARTLRRGRLAARTPPSSRIPPRSGSRSISSTRGPPGCSATRPTTCGPPRVRGWRPWAWCRRGAERPSGRRSKRRAPRESCEADTDFGGLFNG